MSLCVAAAGVVKAISVAAFTLSWVHSVEKVEWQEDWRLTGDGLQIVQARVKGSGAGMEPPAQARRAGAWWQWTPARASQPELVLGDSGAAGAWRLCAKGRCRTLAQITGHKAAAVTVLRVCGE